MNQALEHGENHIEAARQLAERLFSEEHVRLGFRDSLGTSKLSEAGRKRGAFS